MRTVDHDADDAVGDGRIERLPQRVQDALGELAGAAKEGLLALSVGVGLGVLHELMEAEVDEVVGPKGKHVADRTAVRHGHESGEVTLGGRRVPVSRPRAWSADGEREVELGTYSHFARRDQLADVMLERMLVGVSTRRCARAGEPVGSEIDDIARSTSKSAVSREFVSRTRTNLIELMPRPLADLRLAVVMLDGIELKGRCCVVCLGIDVDGIKHPLGLWDGSTENSTVATTLANLVERRISKLLLVHGRVWDQPTAWTQRHRQWLAGQTFEHEPTELAFIDALAALDGLMNRREVLDERLARLALDDRVWPTVARLRCFRGIDTLTALTVHLELGGDWQRFGSARQVGAWLGLTPSLQQSGEASTRQGQSPRPGPVSPGGCWSSRPGTTHASHLSA